MKCEQYNILWFDDKYAESESVILAFDDEGITFTGFTNAEEGVKFLQDAYAEIDAVIIDGNFYANKEDQNIDSVGKALNMVLEALAVLKIRKEIPYFILSGQANFQNRESGIFSIKNLPRIYDKTKREEIEELCGEIKQKIDEGPVRQIMNRYPEVFEICNDLGIGPKHRENLITIIRSLEEDNHYDYNLLRKVLESLFVRLAGLNILPSGFTAEKGWISGASSFLSGLHNRYKFLEPGFIHPVISYSLFRVLQITQDGSHNEGTLTLKIDELTRNQNTGYLYRSTVYAFLEILVYFNRLIKANLDVNANAKRWTLKELPEVMDEEWIVGRVAEIQRNGWGTFISDDGSVRVGIHPLVMAEKALHIKDPVKVVLKEERKDHIKKIEKL